MSKSAPGTSAEHLTPRRRAYADGMEVGVWACLAGLSVAYALYLFGFLPPHATVEQVMASWHLPAGQFREACAMYAGWSWLMAFREGDYLSLLLIAFLASISIGCSIRLIPFLVKERDLPLLFIALVQLAVMVLAASGWVSGGGH